MDITSIQQSGNEWIENEVMTPLQSFALVWKMRMTRLLRSEGTLQEQQRFVLFIYHCLCIILCVQTNSDCTTGIFCI